MLKLKGSSFLPLSFLVLVACQVGPQYKRPKVDVPQLDKKIDISQWIKSDWWLIFDNSILNQLEAKAIKNNYDLKQAIENINVAAAQVDAVFGDLLPSIALGADASKDRISKTGMNYRTPGQPRVIRDYDTKLQASYELDLFGKYRSATDAARGALLATTAARQVVLLSVTSQVAKTYFLIRALEAKLQIAQRTLRTRQETYGVYEKRLRNGYCTQLDYLRVKSELYSVKTTVLNLEKALSVAETSLSVLIGCNPKEMYGWKLPEMRAVDRLKNPAEIPAGIPSDILARRPDVLAAEGQLMSANAKIGEAMAANFPSITLTGAFGFETKSLENLFTPTSDMFHLGAGLTFPIFAGGKIQAMTKAARASYRKQLSAYQKTVQVAFKETLDALSEYRIDSKIVESRTQQVEALRRSYNIATQQKNVGMIDLTGLLDVERGLLATEIDLVDAQYNKLSAIVDVCKAFGGGWKRKN